MSEISVPIAVSPRRTHISALDGVRALAIFLVFAHHHGYLDIGWVGVDLFFVLSGFLITGILRGARHDEGFWSTFWIKRTARIMPPLLLLVGVSYVLGIETSGFRLMADVFSFGDVTAYYHPSSIPLTALWSLAVEEHFYMVWPFVVRLTSRRRLMASLCLILLAEPILRGAASLYNPDWRFVYFLTPFRLDGLALGSLLSLLMESEVSAVRLKRFSGWGIPAALGSWVACRIVFGHGFTRNDPTWMYNSISYAIWAFAGFFTIAFVVNHQRGFVGRLLSSRPLVFIGKISYGMYLYQLVILGLLERLHPMALRKMFWIDTPIIILTAWLSFRFYELPIQRLGRIWIARIAPAKPSIELAHENEIAA